jgi:hypothetical protein
MKKSYFGFVDNNKRTPNSIKFREIWFENFFIQSLIWTFNNLFVKDVQRRFINMVNDKVYKNNSSKGFHETYMKDI